MPSPRLSRQSPPAASGRYPSARRGDGASSHTTGFGGTFAATLFTYPGKGGWTFVEVPADLSPPVTHGWGRTPVTATALGSTWETSVWRGKDGRTLLALPKAVRQGRGHGDVVEVSLLFRTL